MTDAPGGALVAIDGSLMRVALWGSPVQADLQTILDTAQDDPAVRRIELDLSGLRADPSDALVLRDDLRRAGCDVELVVAPGGRVARPLAAVEAPRLRLVDDVA